MVRRALRTDVRRSQKHPLGYAAGNGHGTDRVALTTAPSAVCTTPSRCRGRFPSAQSAEPAASVNEMASPFWTHTSLVQQNLLDFSQCRPTGPAAITPLVADLSRRRSYRHGLKRQVRSGERFSPLTTTAFSCIPRIDRTSVDIAECSLHNIILA